MAGLSRRLSKMPALPRDYLQIPPLEKAITSKKAFLTPTPFCSGSNNPSGMRGTLMPSPFPEQLPPSGTAGACWLHEVETPSQEKKKTTKKLHSNLQIVLFVLLGAASFRIKLWQCHFMESNLQLLPGFASSVVSFLHQTLQLDGGVPLPGSCFGADGHKSETKAARKAGAQGSMLLFSGVTVGNLITVEAGREPRGTVKRDSLHLAY